MPVAITVVAGSAVGASSSTSITKPTSSGYVETTNDLIVVMCQSGGPVGTNVPTLPAGFTSLGSINTNGTGGSVWGYKLDSGSETWPKSFTAAGGSTFDIWSCIILRGQDTTTPIDGTPTTAQITSGSALSIAAITASLAGDTLVILIDNINDVDVSTWPSGVTEYADASNPVGNGVMVGTLASMGSGSTGTLNVTMGATPGLTQACAVLVKAPAAGGGGAAPTITIGGPRGQGMSAPWRTTQRVPLTLYAHNAFTGISESDAMLGAREQFYGDGSQLALPLRPVYGQWPAAGFAGMGRTSLLWRTHNSGTGIAENDLNSAPTGIASEFYSVLWAASQFLVTDSLSLADAVSVSVALTIAETIVLADNVSIAAALTVTDTLTLTDAVSVAVAFTLAETLSLSDTPAVAASLTLAETLTLTDAVFVGVPVNVTDSLALTDAVSVAAAVQLADALTLTDTISIAVAFTLADTLTLSDGVTVGVPINVADTLALADALSVSAAVPLADTLTLVDSLAIAVTVPAIATTLTLADAVSVSVPVNVTDLLALVDTPSIVVLGAGTGPTKIVVSDAPLWATALSDAPVWATVLSDAPLAATGLGDAATGATSVSDAALAQTVLVDA